MNFLCVVLEAGEMCQRNV